MVKIAPRDVDARITQPAADFQAYLIYGPDRGLVNERASRLGCALVDDPDDPFCVTQLTDDDLKADPACLADAVVAMSLTGGRRLVRVRLSGETGNGPIVTLLSELESGQIGFEASLVVESGDLTPRGKLRKAFEPAKKAAAIACYADTSQSLAQIADDMLGAEGLKLSVDARNAWLPRLEGDRGLARGEIEKLILYKGLAYQRDGEEAVDEADIAAIAAEQGEADLNAIIGTVLDGNIGGADNAYARALSGGVSPVAVLRALQRRIDQLGAAQAAGGNEIAIARTGAPRFGPAASQFKRQMSFWSGRRLDAARQFAFDTERAVKKSGSPANALVGDLVLRLARGAAKLRG
jgi:DNA polymerase-3 subunit delta